MIAAIQQTITYYQAPPNYFWKWAEDGKVIEWKNGNTICFTQDLVRLLKAITNSGVPSFGSVLLVLAACNDSWSSSSDCIGILYGLKNSIPKVETDSDDDVIEYYMNQAVKGMDMIALLPKELKKGIKRAHLMHEVFKNSRYVIHENNITSSVDELSSGRLDNYILSNGNEITRAQFKEDLANIKNVFHQYSYPAKLEQQLRTGIFEIPEPAPIEVPAAMPGNLLEQLSAEPRTKALAGLTKLIIAAMNIPMHSTGSSDQPFGGVSDITNKGDYDRLLLSELAYDDNIFLSRLANNEALYFRREVPPDNPVNKRIILVDTTIKMWGIPKVFAMSAAIACTLNVKHKEVIETFMLGGSEALQADTTTANGIMQGLELLDHSLNCCDALHNFFCLSGKR